MRISDWSSDVCSSDLSPRRRSCSKTSRPPPRRPPPPPRKDKSMSFYTSLSGLKASQTDMSVISNNIANAGSVGFKRSKAQFGDIFASSPTQSTKTIVGQGTRLYGITQQLTQGRSEEHRTELQSLLRSSYDVSCLTYKYKI